MTMLSFRVEPAEAVRAREMANALGVPRSELMREALRRHLNALAAQQDAAVYETTPPTPEELSLIDVEQWEPADDWSDWAHEEG